MTRTIRQGYCVDFAAIGLEFLLKWKPNLQFGQGLRIRRRPEGRNNYCGLLHSNRMWFPVSNLRNNSLYSYRFAYQLMNNIVKERIFGLGLWGPFYLTCLFFYHRIGYSIVDRVLDWLSGFTEYLDFGILMRSGHHDRNPD